eukprot:CAMPEP_0171091796 /NCGR_PEP_ID=MMETSP0766_2-20121228/35328_1 /TAXON_ID=439317 /ORGANISM="Gambierdiscus australes, Strain CAWD 149" /LENGTH=98 /DNA_ID=CAMNT_0011549961 /DNA_START=195 /DNA_END=491 /DNA_ORIENTATION=+
MLMPKVSTKSPTPVPESWSMITFRASPSTFSSPMPLCWKRPVAIKRCSGKLMAGSDSAQSARTNGATARPRRWPSKAARFMRRAQGETCAARHRAQRA